MNEARFEVRLDPEAVKEYQKLDNSVVKLVNKAIDELEYRADEVGKKLQNKENTKLSGCKEIKLRDAGIRIIFIVTDQVVNILKIVYVIAIEKRNRDKVFKVAARRYSELSLEDSLTKNEKQWSDSKKVK